MLVPNLIYAFCTGNAMLLVKTSVKSFTLGINRVFSKNGGVMWEKLHDMQLRQFLINELEKNECSCRKKAALIIGKQPESDVYVFSDSVQVRNT